MKNFAVFLLMCLITGIVGSFLFTSMVMAQGTATYELTFTSIWSSSTHPSGFPGNPHFSGMIGGTHNDQVRFWSTGQTASNGIRQMAETGGKSVLRQEVSQAISAGHADDIVDGSGLGSPGSAKVTFEIRPPWNLVTVTSMLAPSPDWFVGVSGLNLLDDDMNWRDEVEVELFVYDAGTDSGPNYESPNQPTSPRENIRRITESPFLVNGAVKPVGTFRFELKKISNAIVIKPDRITVDEGSSSTFNVSLSDSPSSNVTVTIPAFSSTELVLDLSVLTFTTANFNNAQTVTISADQDDNADDETERIMITASGGGYNNVSALLRIDVNDDDVAGAGLTVTPELLTLIEGSSEDIEVNLSAEPTGDVTVTITPNEGLSVNPDVLTFTPGNHSNAQKVAVTAADNSVTDRDRVIRVTFSSLGGGYSEVDEVLDVQVTDDEDTELILSPDALYSLVEGTSLQFTVALSAEPTSDVTVTVIPREGLSVNPAMLTFTPKNYSRPREVTVTATDNSTLDGKRWIRIDMSSSGGGYGNVLAEIDVEVVDNEMSEIMISPTKIDPLLEGATAMFDVSLSQKPVDDVAVTIVPEEGLSVDPPMLTFTPENYSDAQEVTVTAPDNDIVDEPNARWIRIFLSATGGEYDNEEGTVDVNVTDNDMAGLILPESVRVTESGEPINLSVSLSAEPSGDVTVTVVVAEPFSMYLTPNPATLTFTPDNWEIDQEIVLKALKDDNLEDDTVRLTFISSGGGYHVSSSVDVFIQDSGGEIAHIQFIQNIIGADVDVYINGKRILDDFSSKSATPSESVKVEAGPNTLNVVASAAENNDVPLLSRMLDLSPDESYQIIFHGTVGGEISTSILLDEQGNVPPDTVHVRVVHGAPDRGKVDIHLLDKERNQQLIQILGEDMNYGNSSRFYVAVPSRQYNIAVYESSNDSVLEIYAVDWSQSSGQREILILTWKGDSAKEGLNIMEVGGDGGISFSGVVTSIRRDQPMDISIVSAGNFPNPFIEKTYLWFSLVERSDVEVEILDVLGRTKYSRMYRGIDTGEQHQYEINTIDWPSGVYFYRVVGYTGAVGRTILAGGKMMRVK